MSTVIPKAKSLPNVPAFKNCFPQKTHEIKCLMKFSIQLRVAPI